MNFFKKLQDSLKKTSEKFTKGIDEIFNKSKPQVEILQDIEEYSNSGRCRYWFCRRI